MIPGLSLYGRSRPAARVAAANIPRLLTRPEAFRIYYVVLRDERRFDRRLDSRGIEHRCRAGAPATSKCGRPVKCRILNLPIGQWSFSTVPPIELKVVRRIAERLSMESSPGRVVFAPHYRNEDRRYRELAVGKQHVGAKLMERGFRHARAR